MRADHSITDSLWFWLAVFSAMALVGLFAVGPKYLKREAIFEQKALSRQGIRVHDPAAGQPADNAAASSDNAPAGGELTSPSIPAEPNLLVPLWPLKLLAAAVCAASCVMLWRQARNTSPQR